MLRNRSSFGGLVLASVLLLAGANVHALPASGGGSEAGNGGGTTRCAKELTPEEIRSVLFQDSVYLREYLGFIEWWHAYGRAPLSSLVSSAMSVTPPSFDEDLLPRVWEALFDGEQTVFDVLDRLTIEVRHSAACRDARGNEVDGSADLASGNRICISAKRLAEKLTCSDVEAQVWALVLHEISHLLGTSEAEALQLQNSAFLRLLRNSAMQRHWKLRFETESDLERLLEKISWLEPEPLGMCRLAAVVREGAGNLMKDLHAEVSDFTVLRARDQDQVLGLFGRAWALEDYSCGLDLLIRDPKFRAAHQGYYARGFGEDLVAPSTLYTWRKFADPSLPRNSVAFAEVTLERITTPAAHAREIERLRSEARSILGEVRAILESDWPKKEIVE